MEKLENLLNRLCPDGLEYKRIGDVVDYEQPSKYLVKSTDYNDEYATPVLTAGQTFILGYTDETDGIFQASVNNPVIIFDDFTGAFKWVDFPFKAKSSAMKMLNAKKDSVYLRYIFHVMGNIGYSSDEHKRLWIGVYSNISIPIPPLEVQTEIVRILDKFTELTTELTTELATELANRKKQYEYYLNDIFSSVQAEYEPMEKHFPFIRNGFVGTVTSFFTDAEHGVRYLEGKNIHNGIISDNEILYVTKDFHQKHIRNELKPDDILMVQSGHVGECAVVGEKYAGANCHALIIMSNGGNVNSKYVTYYFMSAEGKRKLEKITTGGTIKHILASGMKKVTIPVPPIEEQQRIVNILDRFDKLCNDISEGLLAEIEARQKQYEYYRDKLLTFKELK